MRFAASGVHLEMSRDEFSKTNGGLKAYPSTGRERPVKRLPDNAGQQANDQGYSFLN